MGEEWLNSRAAAIGEKPGMGRWAGAESVAENRSPLSATALQEERINIYRQWTEQVWFGCAGFFYGTRLAAPGRWPQQHLK